MKLKQKEIDAINKHKPLLKAVKSLVQVKEESNKAGMTLRDYMVKMDLMPDTNSPAYKLILGLHN